jgi:hypothetical protein
MRASFLPRNCTTVALLITLSFNAILVYRWPTEIQRPPCLCDLQVNCTKFETKGEASLALVVPFPETFLHRVLHNTRTLWNSVVPCFERQEKVDILFYTNFEKNEHIEAEILRAFSETPKVRNCFRNIRFFQANLNSTQDQYPFGPNNMFCRIFQRPILLEYDYIFYFEQDTRPIRPNWLPLLQAQVNVPEKFWIKGSTYFGNKFVPQEFWYCRACFFHINGNALYGIGDEEFRRVSIRICDEVERTGEHYDQKFARFWMDDFNNWNYTKMVFHKVVFSNFLQNWWATMYDLDKILKESPETFFIHGGDAYNRPKEW